MKNTGYSKHFSRLSKALVITTAISALSPLFLLSAQGLADTPTPSSFSNFVLVLEIDSQDSNVVTHYSDNLERTQGYQSQGRKHDQHRLVFLSKVNPVWNPIPQSTSLYIFPHNELKIQTSMHCTYTIPENEIGGKTTTLNIPGVPNTNNATINCGVAVINPSKLTFKKGLAACKKNSFDCDYYDPDNTITYGPEMLVTIALPGST